MSSKDNQTIEETDGKLQGETKAGQQGQNSNSPPPFPIIPDDDIDDSDENFPLITSVFSLASVKENDEVESSETKKNPKSPKEVTSPEVVTKSPCSSPQENGKVAVKAIPKTITTTPNQVNAPYYVGKGKLILPKTEDSKPGMMPQASGMTFSKMVSIHPITTSEAKSNEKKETQSQTSGILTRSALKKADSVATSTQANQVTGSSTPASTASTSGGKGQVMINLSSTLPFLNVKLATTQIAVPPINTPATTLSTSVLSSTSPLVQLIKRIAPTGTNISPNVAAALVKSTITAPVVSPPKLPLPTLKVQKPRHVNIAPAPTNTANATRFVMVPQTAVSTPVSTNQVASTTQISSNVPRVVMVPKLANSTAAVKVPTGQLMYLIENKTADGKTFRFLIPTDSAKIISTPVTTSSQSPAAAATPTAATSKITVTSSTQLIKIIPKPLQTNVVTQIPKVAAAAPPTVSISMSTGNVTQVLNTGTPTLVTGNITPPGSTSPINMINMTSPISEQDSINTPPISPASAEEAPSNDDSLDSGLSPHEARIQKLKELLKKQEDAVERLREKRKKEIDDIRAPVAKSTIDGGVGEASKRDCPFAVPLPPKKSRLERYNRKHNETSTQTSKDGFLPSSDDQQFVKLVGLEKVVDKLKAKKMSELQENKVSN